MSPQVGKAAAIRRSGEAGRGGDPDGRRTIAAVVLTLLLPVGS